MASLFLDHNLSRLLAALLRRADHVVTIAHELQLDRATDAEILLLMARAGLIVVTADTDFAHLHQMAEVEHAGILLVPQTGRADAATVADAITGLLGSGRPLANELHAWTREAGWERWNQPHGWTPL